MGDTFLSCILADDSCANLAKFCAFLCGLIIIAQEIAEICQILAGGR
jgi:hypothetical protein